MPGDMNLSINGQSQVPPGFRFHPTEEELLHYYLRKKVAYEKIDLDVIREVDLNKLEPWDIQEKCKIGSTPQNDWYFFSHKDKKYPTGTRTNRATAAGFWKATGRDKIIYSGFRRIGLRKTLVFYKGRAPHGQKSDWIMHEYRLDDSNTNTTTNYDSSNPDPIGEATSEEGWVVCRVFRKKNYHKSLDQHGPKGSTLISMDSKTKIMSSASNNEDGVLDQILLYMGRNSKLNMQDNEAYSARFLTNSPDNHLNNMIMSSFNEAAIINDRSFLHLPRLDSPSPTPSSNHFRSSYNEIVTPTRDQSNIVTSSQASVLDLKSGLVNDWVTLDRLVASQLNGQGETSKQLSCFTSTDDHDHDRDPSFSVSPGDDDHEMLQNPNINATFCNTDGENELWSFTKSSSSPSSSVDPLCHLSV